LTKNRRGEEKGERKCHVMTEEGGIRGAMTLLESHNGSSEFVPIKNKGKSPRGKKGI